MTVSIGVLQAISGAADPARRQASRTSAGVRPGSPTSSPFCRAPERTRLGSSVYSRGEGVRVGDTADRVAVRMDCESERCGCTGLVEGGEDVVEDDAGSKSRIRVRPCGRHSVVNLGRALRHRAAASAGLAVRSSAMTALVRCAKTGAARRRIRTAGRTLCRLRAWGVRPTL